MYDRFNTNAEFEMPIFRCTLLFSYQMNIYFLHCTIIGRVGWDRCIIICFDNICLVIYFYIGLYEWMSKMKR